MTRTEAATLLATHPRFAWADGMLTTEGYRLVHRIEFAIVNEAAVGHWMFAADGKRWHDDVSGHVPDPADMATAGVLLGMLSAEMRAKGVDVKVRFRAIADVHIRLHGPGWDYVATGATLGEAVASALLAVWGPA